MNTTPASWLGLRRAFRDAGIEAMLAARALAERAQKSELMAFNVEHGVQFSFVRGVGRELDVVDDATGLRRDTGCGGLNSRVSDWV